MQRRLGRCAAAVVVLVLTAPAHAGSFKATPGSAARPRIVNGTLTSDFPSVGMLVSPANPDQASEVCTGTLVGCSTFVTAAHCVCSGRGSQCQGTSAPPAGAYAVFLQHAGYVAVSRIAVHPDFDFPVADVAVLTLATPVTGIAPMPINTTRALAAGTAATIVGFGRSGGDPGSNVDYGLKRVGAISTTTCSGTISNTSSICWDFDDPLGPPGTDSDTCNGDSGGPLLADFGCGPTLAGITSGGDSASCLPSDRSYDANVFAYRAFILAQAGADLDATACGAMPQAGEANAPVTAVAGTLDFGTSEAVHPVVVPAGSTELRVTLNGIDDGSSDFDLYVKRGTPPTTGDYDCRAAGPNQFGFCGFTNPAQGTWYLLVRRFGGQGLYQVTATVYGSGAPGSTTNGLACDDLNDCTGSDVCAHGNCSGAAVANGSTCDDGSVCTAADACISGTCVGTPTPMATCLQPQIGGKASIFLRDTLPDGRDRLTWKWSRGTTTLADFGSPATAGFELCVFDQRGGTTALALDASIPAGPRWSTTTRGWKYKDPSLSADGVSVVTLRTGLDADGSITLKAKGTSLPLPALPLQQDGAVTVQLHNPNTCWGARYSSHIANRVDLFRAKAD